MTRLSAEFRTSLATMAAAYGLALLGEDSSAQAARACLSGRGLSMDVCSKYAIGLVTDEFDENRDYAGMLCFPYITTLGGVVSLKFARAHSCKQLGCSHARFYTPYHESRLYNPKAFDLADQLGYVCICEGETDTLTLDALVSHGDLPAVGVPGVESWKGHPEWKELFRGYSKVYVLEDQDEINPNTGKRPGEELAKAIRADIDTAVIVKLPGKDVNDTYLRFGPKVIREKINAG